MKWSWALGTQEVHRWAVSSTLACLLQSLLQQTLIVHPMIPLAFYPENFIYVSFITIILRFVCVCVCVSSV